MGVTKQQAIENKKAIVAAAEKLFRERGVAAVGLAELTKAAGFTQGGFYNHFKSKDALVAAVMEKAMEDGAADLLASIAASRAAAAADPLERHIEGYLSAEHLANIERGCPLMGFAGDIRRLGKEARETYARGLHWNIDQFMQVIDGNNEQDKRSKAIALFSQMVGALVLARAVVDADPALAEEILKDGRRQLLQAGDA